MIVIATNDTASYGNPIYDLIVLNLFQTFYFLSFLHALFALPLCGIFVLVFHSMNGQISSSDFLFMLYLVNHFLVLTLYSTFLSIISVLTISLHIITAQPFQSIRGTFCCFLSH